MGGGRGKKAAETPKATGTLPLPGLDPNAPASKKGRGSKAKNNKDNSATFNWKRRLAAVFGRSFGVSIEIAALVAIGLAVIVLTLSRFAGYFVGDSLGRNLLPFAGTVLGLGVATAIALKVWLYLRRQFMRIAYVGRVLPAILAIGGVAAANYLWWTGTAHEDVRQLQTLVGGPAEAERAAIAHQVFAAYRRSDLAEMRTILERGVVYETTIREAAEAMSVDAELLMGIAATESSFYPRPSKDGGQGLFQITKPPTTAVAEAKKRLSIDKLDPVNQRHNAFIGAATFKLYHEQMRGDLFLGLLAYNIGPHNGGLRSIMQQYGARDFMTIQPYLKHLPRDYPIRVLAAALAYRLWRQDGSLPRYEEGTNAMRIQDIGIPGLERSPILPQLVVSAEG